MSERYGFDFDGDGKVSFEESYLTYHIERETIRNNETSPFENSSLVGTSSTGRTGSGGVAPYSSGYPDISNEIIQPSDGDSFFKSLWKIGVIILLIIIGIIAICVINDRIAKQNAYDRAISLIQQEKYIYAINALRNLGWSDPKHNYYQDLDTLEDYCWGMDYYRSGKYIEATSHLGKCIGRMDSHSDLRSPYDVIQEIAPLAEQQREENKRRAEEAERKRQEEWRKNGAPYVGMKESEITKTSIGRYSKTSGNYKGAKRCNLYYWFNSKGEQIYSVRCCDGEVIQVWDDRSDPRSFKVNSTKPYYNSSGSSSNEDDEYNVKDYYSAEDFYDDHYDDFFDYYDAEDYYNDHGGF